MEGQLATASFDHQHPQAPDNRMQRTNLNARNEISPWIRWEGMQVYVVQEQKTYQLVGGTGNEHWQEIAAGGGASNFVGQFPTFEDLPDSGSPGDYAYVGTGDDFVQYNWDQIAGEWRLNSAETKVSDEDFFLGRVPSEPDRVMFSMRRNSIIYSTGGTQSISPDRMANYVFTGENVTLENVNYSGDGGEEFHITNRTGSNLTILSSGNFASGLTIPAGHMASFKSSDDGWVQSFVNEEYTFSDTLDSVNAKISVGPDGKEVLSGIFDRYLGKEIQFKEVETGASDGFVIVVVGGKIFKRTDKEYFIESFGTLGAGNDSVVLQRALDGVSKTDSKKLVIDKHDLILTDTVSSSENDLILEFRNGAKISQPTPSTWEDQDIRLELSGDRIRFINLKTDGKFNNEGLNGRPNPVRHFVVVSGNDCMWEGDTVLENSGGYNLDIRGDRCVMKGKVFGKNNAYSSLRFFASGPREYFKIDHCQFVQNFGPISRKTGLTVNGENYVDLIEIGTYIGLNAGPFTEAEVGGPGTPYYRNLKIGYLKNDYTVDTQNADGSTASSFSSKLENVEKLTIGKIENINNSPESKGQGMWYNQVDVAELGEVFTNAGDWSFGKTTKIGSFHFEDTGNNGDVLMRCVQGGHINIGEISTKVTTLRYNGIFLVSVGGRYRVGNYINTGEMMGIAKSSIPPEPRQIIIDRYQGDLITNGSFPASYRQAVSYSGRSTVVVNLTSITRDVERGEIFLFSTSPYLLGIFITSSGSMSWSGGSFTGTAKFEKFFNKQNYTGSALTNLLSILSDENIGDIFRVNGVPAWFNGYYFDPISPRLSINRTTTNYVFVLADSFRYVRLTGASGNATVSQDTFNSDSELQGEIEGGAKTFVAGAGVTLRYPDGGTNVAPTNSRFFIKFKSPNDAQLTIVPSTIPENTYDTFIPQINGSTANPTASYTEQFGDYALIDRLCHFEVRLNWQSMTGGTGLIRIPLPVARLRNTANGGPSIAVMTGLSTATPIYACYSGFNNIGFRNAAGNEISVSDLESEGVIALSGTYIIGE